MNSKSVSLCMIVKNEEKYLEKCLQSVTGKVNEIIIVDTGSMDRTKDIAKKYTDKVYDFLWINDFSAARNYALSFATSDYILQMDADEVLDDPENELAQNLDKDYYYIRIKNDLGSGQYLSHHFIRLFKNSPEIRYKGALHEQVPFDHKTGKYGHLSMVILHEGYKRHIVNEKHKIQRNLNILLKAIKEEPTAFNYYNLGMQYLIEERYSEALTALKKSYSLGSHFAFSQKVVLDIMKCLQSLGQFEEAIKIGEDAVQLYKEYPDFWYQKGLTYMEWGLYMDAELCFQKCLEIGEGHAAKLVQHYDGTGSFLAQAKLAEINLFMNKTNEALDYIILAVKASPDTLALFDIFLSIYPNANSKDLFLTISKLWPFSNQRYTEFVGYLYRQRNPLLKEFIDYFNIDVVFPISTLIHVMYGSYEQAVNELVNKKSDSKEEDPFLINNVILLAISTRNAELMDRFRFELQLSSKEFKWLREVVVEGKVTSAPTSKKLLSLWRQLIVDSIQFQNYAILDQLIKSTDHPQLRLIIAECLQSFGFDELTLQVIVESNHRELNRNIYITAAKSLRKLGNPADALYYFKKAEQIQMDYMVLFEQWRIMSETDKQSEIEILEKMKSYYPMSKWASQMRRKV